MTVPRITISAGRATVRLPDADRRALIAELSPCGCNATKSTGTAALRSAFRGALEEHGEGSVCLSEVHGMRVALGACGCGRAGAVSARLSAALARVR